MSNRITILAALVAASLAPARAAQQVDPETMMKWSLAEVVHYDVVAEYSRSTRVLTGGSLGIKRATDTPVKDRFEVSFDVSPATGTVIGKPAFKNSPSIMTREFPGACQPPRVDGPYEHLEVIDVKPAMGELTLMVKRVFPGGAIPSVNENNVCGLESVGPKTETLEHVLPVIPGKFLVMAQLAPKHIRIGEKASETNTVTIGNDEKTIVVDDTAVAGWKYTYTLRIVK